MIYLYLLIEGNNLNLAEWQAVCQITADIFLFFETTIGSAHLCVLSCQILSNWATLKTTQLSRFSVAVLPMRKATKSQLFIGSIISTQTSHSVCV